MEKLITNYLDEIDKENSSTAEKKSTGTAERIFIDLGLSDENTICDFGKNQSEPAEGNRNTLEKLSQLAFSASKETQSLFAEATKKAVTRCPGETVENVPKKNREVLFKDPMGRKLLSSLLLWNNDNKGEVKSTDAALESLSQDILELIENASFVPISETIITDWVSLTLFQRTIKPSDESSKHIFHTFQIDHAYKSYQSNPLSRSRIYIPGASVMLIAFDKKFSSGKEDSLIFYSGHEVNPTKHPFSGTEFRDFEIPTINNIIYFEFDIKSTTSTNESFGWRFDVRASFPETKVGSDNNRNDLRFEIVSSSKGIDLIQSYANSSNDITSRFSALTLANLTMSTQSKELIFKVLRIDFFLSLPKTLISMRTTAICIDELLEDENIRESALIDPDIGPRLLKELTRMTRTDDFECNVRAVSCLEHLASKEVNIPILLKYKCFETLVDAAHSSHVKVSSAAWRGLKHFTTDKKCLLAYGQGTYGDMPKYRGPILEYDMFLSESSGLDSPSLKIDVPINREGIECINSFLSNDSLSNNIINKVYIEVKVTKGVNGRIGIVPAQDTWTFLKTHGKMIGDDALSWGIDGQRNKVFNNGKAVSPVNGNGVNLPTPFWREGSTIGLLVNPIDKVLEISLDGGGSFFPLPLSSPDENEAIETALDWTTGVVFSATFHSNQGMSFNVGQDLLICPHGSVSLLDYALLNEIEFPIRPLIFDRTLTQFVDISDGSFFTDNRKTTAESDEVILLRNVIRLLFVNSLNYADTATERDRNIFTKCTIEESSHPLSVLSSSYERTFRWPGATSVIVDLDKINLGKSNKNYLLFKYKGIDGILREKKVTDLSFKKSKKLLLHCGVENVNFSVCLEPDDVYGWGYSFKIYPMFADDGCGEGNAKIEESDHPYKYNPNSKVCSLKLDEAEAILITFDKESKTQDGDYIQFYSDSSMNNPIGTKYCGTNFPGVGDVPPLVIVGSEFFYQWISVGNNIEDFGWRFTYASTQHPFLKLCALPFAKLIESPNPCPIGYESRIEVDNTQCPVDVFSLHFHETSFLDVETVIKNEDNDENMDDIGMLEQSWLEVYVRDDDNDVVDISFAGGRTSSIDNVDSKLKLVGERYVGWNLPGIGATEDLLIPSKRFCIKYYIADNHASTVSPSKARRLPRGFKAVAFPSEALPESWTVDFEHGNNRGLGINHNMKNDLISSFTAIIDDILPHLSSTDTLTKEYCGGILCNVSYSNSAISLLKEDIRPNVLKALDEMLKSEWTWPQVMAATIISNLATLVTVATSQVSINQLVLESGLMGSLLSMWCHSDSFTQTLTSEGVSCVLSAISKKNSAPDNKSTTTSDNKSITIDGYSIVAALFAMLESGIDIVMGNDARQLDSPANSICIDRADSSRWNETVHNTASITSRPHTPDVKMSSIADERLMQVIAESLADMTELDGSTRKPSSSGPSIISPNYLKDFLRFLRTPYPKVTTALLSAIKNILSNRNNLSNVDGNEHLHFIFEILLDGSNIKLQELAAEVIETILTLDYVSDIDCDVVHDSDHEDPAAVPSQAQAEKRRRNSINKCCVREAMKHIDDMMSAIHHIDFASVLDDSQDITEIQNNDIVAGKSILLQSAFVLFDIMTVLCEDSEFATYVVTANMTYVQCLVDVMACGGHKLKDKNRLNQKDGNSTTRMPDIMESSHPYEPNLSKTMKLKLNDSTSIDMSSTTTSRLKVWFDSKTSTVEGTDTLEFFLDEFCITSIAGPFSGDSQDWPTMKSPLYLPLSSEIWISFESGARQVSNWGWKFYALPAEDPYLQRRKERYGTIIKSSKGFPDSEYESCLDTYEKVEIKDAKALEIVFHPRSETERNYDYIQYFKDDSHTEYWGNEKYSGPYADKCFPNCNDPLIIPVNNFIIHFHSDVSNEYIGYEMIISEPQEASISNEI
eukprot:gene7407-15127_t